MSAGREVLGLRPLVVEDAEAMVATDGIVDGETRWVCDVG